MPTPPILLLLLVLALSGCSIASTPAVAPGSPSPESPAEQIPMPDGTALRLRTWGSPEPPTLVLLGVHGFNDYSQAFAALEPLLADLPRTRIYAYDQRGHGHSGEFGRWAGAEQLRDDLRSVARSLRARHPDATLVVLGESMGGAVVLTALNGDEGLDADAIALLAPAVWGRDVMPWYQRFALWLARNLIPGVSFSGSVPHDLGIRPTDDPAVSRALSRDPLVQKEARADTLHGVTGLMTEAAAQTVPPYTEVLFLYGLRDTVIPPGAVCAWLQRLDPNPATGLRIAIYPGGYHLLTRQTRAPAVLADLRHWLSTLGDGGADAGADGPDRLVHEQSLGAARDAVCALPAAGLREPPGL